MEETPFSFSLCIIIYINVYYTILYILYIVYVHIYDIMTGRRPAEIHKTKQKFPKRNDPKDHLEEK